MKFCGREVYFYNYWAYPAVYWPEHPESWSNGLVHVHRIVAHKKYEGIPEGFDVHHVDGDPENWDDENLVLIEHGKHTLYHLTGQTSKENLRVVLQCHHCGDEVERLKNSVPESGTVYCNVGCVGRDREVIDWPSRTKLFDMVNKFGYVGAGRKLGVSDNAIRERLNTYTGS